MTPEFVLEFNRLKKKYLKTLSKDDDDESYCSSHILAEDQLEAFAKWLKAEMKAKRLAAKVKLTTRRK